MNPVINNLLVELNKVVDGDPWYGASLKSIFEEIDFTQAVKRIKADAHSIVEITLHMLAWIEEVARRLEGNEPNDPQRGDWQIINALDNDEWESIVKNIYVEHKKIETLVSTLSLEKLEQRAGVERNPALGTGLSYREMLVGLKEHNVYHAGQIALLKKLI